MKLPKHHDLITNSNTEFIYKILLPKHNLAQQSAID